MITVMVVGAHTKSQQRGHLELDDPPCKWTPGHMSAWISPVRIIFH